MSTISAIQTNSSTNTGYTSKSSSTDTKSIEAQIASLTSDLANVSSDDKLKDDEKEAKKMSIQSQIDALKAELASANSSSSTDSTASSSSKSVIESSQSKSLSTNALLNEDGDYFTKTKDEELDEVQNEYSKTLQNVDSYKQMASLLLQSTNI